MSNLGYTVNGKPLDPGTGKWDPNFFNPTSRGARVTERWGGTTKAGFTPVRNRRKLPKAQRTPPPTRTEMLARLKAGLG